MSSIKPHNKIEHPDAPENPYISTGYVRLPDVRDVVRNMRSRGRAPEPSPLLKEYMQKQIEKLNEAKS